ncbi:MAG: glycosyltransferase family 4 protein [Chloroflexi bacterium]|nr:glycosyltransferase family 4 protein [Chloroflexota bacterium]
MTASVIPASNLRIGFVSTRFDSTDGVSLETLKWCHILSRLGHTCFFFAGLCDCPAGQYRLVPEAHFEHPDILAIYTESFTQSVRSPETTRKIHEISQYLKEELYRFVKEFDIHLLLVENALAIPLNIPLGIALTEFIAETGIHTIAHHHDFFWERERFLANCVWDYLEMAFPPRLRSVRHVAINSLAADQLAYRRGVSPWIIPNVMDFDHPPTPPDEYTDTLRVDLKLEPGHYLFLQPTRVVRRKGIEISIELINRLNLPVNFVVSHSGGDEGDAYERHVRGYAKLLNVKTNFASDIVSEHRDRTPDGRKVYSLWDVYPFADLVTYPSLLEGFGNGFLEAVYFRRPILVNNYTTYAVDIKPKGFRAIEFEGFITDETVAQVRRVLTDKPYVQQMVEQNYQLAKRFYSYGVLEHQLRALLHSFVGQAV